uniref:adenosylcobinamide-GDP ribazoletransferase n=1 Tax=Stappia sp. TaxID=1870903 RepID=UPI003BAB99BF
MERAETTQASGSPFSPSRMIADLAALLRFFSRVPVPRLGRLDDPAALPAFPRAGALTPVAAVILALPGALTLCVLAASGLPTLAVALVTIGVCMAVTGALHEDGLADVADGFFGASTRERRLEIMKDSRIGAFGALALVIGVGLRASLLAALLERFGIAGAGLALLGAEAASRSAMILLWSSLPPARPDGLSAACGKPGKFAAVVALGIGLAALAPLPAFTGPVPLAAALLATGLLTYGLCRLALAKIGGQTGDVLGACQQVALVALLAGLALEPATG